MNSNIREIPRQFPMEMKTNEAFSSPASSEHGSTTFLKMSKEVYLNTNQLDALNFLMSLFHASTSFEHTCSSSGGQNCTIQPLVPSHL